MKSFYISAWILFTITALVTVLTGTFSSPTLVVLSLVTFGLVYALALWSILTNTREAKTE